MKSVVSAVLLAMAVLLALPACAMADPSAPTEPDLTALRELYLRAVQDERAIDRGLAEIERVREAADVREGSALDGTLAGYRGALVTLRAKHAFWPPQKLRHLERGLEILDGAVRAHPDHAEVRYLRLMSCYYLPGILGRQRSVREDFAALARLLPGVRGSYPPQLYGAIARFVIENGRLPDAQLQALEATLPAADG